MPRHAPPPVYPSRAWWAEMVAAGALGLTAFVAAAHGAAPKVAAAERFTAAPEASEPIAHGGPLAIPSIGWLPTADTTTTTEGTSSWPAATAVAHGPVSHRRTAPSATSTSGRSAASTVTAPQVTTSTPQDSPHEAAGASSGSPTDPSGTRGSSTPIESTPSTQSASPSETPPATSPETTTAATTTAETTEPTTTRTWPWWRRHHAETSEPDVTATVSAEVTGP